MQTAPHEINEVVGLPTDHTFGADYLQRFPIHTDLPRPRDVFDWLSDTGYWQWIDTEEVKALIGFVDDRLTMQAVHSVIEGFKADERNGRNIVRDGLHALCDNTLTGRLRSSHSPNRSINDADSDTCDRRNRAIRG